MSSASWRFKSATAIFAFILSAAMQAAATAGNADYTVTVAQAPFKILETSEGEIIDFTITNKLAVALTVGGYAPDIVFIFGDDTDDFEHSVLGPATPYVIPANGVQEVPVLIEPDEERDDPNDRIGGIWSFTLFPEVFIGVNPNGGVAGLPVALGSNQSAEIDIVDAPEPRTMTIVLVLGGLIWTGSRWRWIAARR